MFLFLQKLYTPVLIQDRPYFHFKENILNINRVAPESEELVKIIDERAKEKKLGYCYFLSYYDVDGIQLSPNRTLLPSVDLRALAHKNAFDVTYAGGQEVNPWERTENCSIFITDHREYMKSAEKAGGHEIANIHSERMPLGLRVYEFKK